MRPTRLRKLVPTTPAYIGACDACQHGMGGVWFGAESPPLVWRQPFPGTVQRELVTNAQPTGTLSISDLKLAALIAHKDVLSSNHPVAERTIWTASDNRAALTRSTAGSATSIAARAYLVLRMNALHQRRYRYVATQHHIAGKANVMADDASFSLATADVTTRHQFGADWRVVQAATHDRVSRQRASAAHSSWNLWTIFCNDLQVDPVPILQVFAQCLRAGTLTPGRGSVRSRSVEESLRAVGQGYAGMGSPDPCLNVYGAVDFRLAALYHSWAKVDPPPSRVKPLPMILLAQVVALARLENSALAAAEANTLICGHFYLLRPREYLGRPNLILDDHFRLRDLAMWVGTRAVAPLTCLIADLRAATFSTLAFTRQKNGVRGEKVGHAGRSGHPQHRPVFCLVERVRVLRSLSAPPSTPLNAFGPSTPDGPLRYVTAGGVTARPRVALVIYPDPSLVLTGGCLRPSTRGGGATELLCAGVNRDRRIRKIGRWRSEEMFRYLHLQAQSLITGVSAAMLRDGTFQLAPG